MYYVRLVFKNIFRHRLRSLLTIVGLVIAILAFGLLQTVVNAWYAGADMASANRLVTRNATSLVFAMPAYYRERIKAILADYINRGLLEIVEDKDENSIMRDFVRAKKRFSAPAAP